MNKDVLKNKLKTATKISAICLGLMLIPFGSLPFPEIFAKLYNILAISQAWFTDFFFGIIVGYITLIILAILIPKKYIEELTKKIDEGKYTIVAIISILESISIVLRICYSLFIRQSFNMFYIIYLILAPVIVITSIYKLNLILKITNKRNRA